MKTKVYLRVAKTGTNRVTVAANVKPNNSPLIGARGHLPTVAFGISLDIPDKLFNQAGEIIAELTIPEDQATIAAEVRQ